MRTTLELPDNLLKEAMEILNTKTKSDTIKQALEEIIRTHKRKKLITYRGKIDLDIDLDALRDR